jgi:outer membrane protein OmpA-like peptidoglycan-associated protein
LVPEKPAPVVVEALAAAAPIVAAAAPIVAAAAPVVVKMVHTDKDDDYLLCKEYHGHTVTDARHNVALFTHSNGLHYFAVYHPDGNVKLRSEGFVTHAKREEELALVIKLIDNASSYSTIEKAGYEMKILKDMDGREVGRSCPKKIVIAAAAPPPPLEMAAPAAGGFKWWYLLPLLLIPLFFLWKSCNKPVADVVVPVEVTTPPVVADTVKVVENVTAPAATTDCSLNWILFDFDKYDITPTANAELQTLITILKGNASYTADLRAFTDAKGSDVYNQNLSRNRANAAKQVLIAAGIDAARIKAEPMSESQPVAKNTEDDSGRHFNRRVELYVLDADGKEVCKSIAPPVPADLKN